MKINQSKNTFYIISGLMFLLMLLCNFLTGKYCDDFAYCYSFATKERIDSLFDIFPSIYAHGNIMNGRAVAHFFAQLFLMLPPAIFKIINSGMFVLQIILIYFIAKPEKEHNNLIFMGVFGAVWCFEPAFGQVNLWLDGACNYLWSIVFGLIFIYPFINLFLYDRKIKNKLIKVLFVFTGFIAGAYLENASAAIIFAAILLLILTKFHKKYKLPICSILSAVASITGYATMLMAPGTAKNKAAELTLQTLRVNFMTALEMMNEFRPLLIAFTVLLVIAVAIKADKDKILLSSVFALTSVCANFILTVASYYPERCAFCSAVFLTVAVAILTAQLFKTEYKIPVTAMVWVMLLITSYNLMLGINDIYATEKQRRAGEEYIMLCKSQGITEVELPLIQATTKYSPAYEIKYLDTEDPTTWPNYSMAKFYEITSIIGR